jgi:hypothetical protein
MYTIEIISLLTWPLIIYGTYHLVKFVLRRYDKAFPEEKF